ncbi:MAG TPA: GNAT family N-acetyltransferase [Steroidobacteraceae bacterium]|nr:GNAT family N-acetyltransferase [Steroidobacteraceae bacterium]
MPEAAPYPGQWEREACTRDGEAYHIRPIRPDDAARERAFIVGLSPESRYARLMHTVIEPPPELVERFVHVDYRRSMAFVATLGAGELEQIIGVARYATSGTGECEFAVVVSDAWQARGVGGILTHWLFDYARAQGIRTLRAVVLATNQRMIDFVRWLGMTIHWSPEDSATLEATLSL